MTQISDYLENAWQNHVFRNTALTSPTTVYLALFTVTPSDAGGGTEVSTGGYARVAVEFDAPSSGVTQNTNIETWTASGAAFGTIVAWGIFDALTVGNLLFWDAVDASQTVNDGETVEFAAGALVIQHAASPKYTVYLQNAFLNHVLRNTALTSPTTVYFALFTTTTDEDGNGTEVTGSGYARLVATFAAPSGGSISKSGTYQWTPSGGNYGTVTDAAVFDALTVGNMLTFDALATSRVVNDGDTFELTQFDSVLA